VARNFAESVWVHFKVIGIPVALFVFMLPQVFWLASKAKPPREQRLRERLESRFAPTSLTIEDESHLHAGHAGAAGGHSHFRVTIVAEAFRGVSPVARHRLVYAAVDDMLKTDIHALAIEASAPPA
jgi:BolA protein